jgi:Domain of unknown function (DUF4440)
MKRPLPLLFAHLCLLVAPLLATEPSPEQTRLKELDAYWAEVSRAVETGDFAAYEATCHPEGVLVAGAKKTCTPLADALKRWKKEFDATRSGEMQARVSFAFAQRLGDATTAHETGMFRYTATPAGGNPTPEYIHFEGLLVKRDGRWQILMEYQKSPGTRAEYEALISPVRPN